MKFLIIFPTKKQLEYIKNSRNFNCSSIYCLVKSSENLSSYVKNNIRIIETSTFDGLVEELGDIELKVLCCTEEAIYWLNNHKTDNMILNFDEICLKMLNKWDAYLQLKNFPINTTKKVLYPDIPQSYPIIAKPNIGFGSLNVRLVESNDALVKYVDNFNNLLKTTPIHEYNNVYFSNTNNSIILEEYVENGLFFSVPFVADKNRVKRFFPIEGTIQYKSDFSDFHWIGFKYDLDNLSNEMSKKISECLNMLSKCFITDTGVYMAELIYDLKQNCCHIIEFSPRMPGGKLPDLIKTATGIDIEDLSIELFLNEEYKKDDNITNYVKSLLLINNNFIDLDLSTYNLVFEEKQYSNVFKQEISNQIWIECNQ